MLHDEEEGCQGGGRGQSQAQGGLKAGLEGCGQPRIGFERVQAQQMRQRAAAAADLAEAKKIKT